MACKDCYGCIFMHNHTVVDKTAEVQKVDINLQDNSENEKPVEVFKTKRTLSGKLIGVRNETKALN